MKMSSLGLTLAATTAAIIAVPLANPVFAQPPTPAEPGAAAAARTTTLHGTVTTGDNQPQPGASVTVLTTGAQVVTDDNGEYTLAVPPGTHTVRVETPG